MDARRLATALSRMIMSFIMRGSKDDDHIAARLASLAGTR